MLRGWRAWLTLGAALLEKYADADTSGFLTNKEEDLGRVFEQALRRGLQVETHAIGDRANRIILDLYENAFKTVRPNERKIAEPRWRIEHAQILSPPDIPRFARLGVIPSMQPSHAISDLFFAPSRLGLARLAGAYAWQSLLKTGAIIPAGSDAPVERGEPMIENCPLGRHHENSGAGNFANALRDDCDRWRSRIRGEAVSECGVVGWHCATPALYNRFLTKARPEADLR